MNKHIAEIIKAMKEENQRLYEEKKLLEQKNMHLVTTISDHRYTIKQLKRAIDKRG
jgi:hypothetical protein